ncbi:MAG: hypothetical protein MUF49_14580 [Oculatellaceae cyanobacterium Prado106]|jgi:Ca2+-binding RTX toxin-like protein|nr:hypothetical protein [Oculatellaceae cyanobacterium Prado106]
MTNRINSAQTSLDALLALLENNDLGEPVRRRRFTGNREANFYIGDERNNVADGRRGDDVLRGNAGDDQLSGGGGQDLIFGGDGIDVIDGGSANDTILGEAGADQLSGGGGSDFLDGGSENDTILGGRGSDLIVGNTGVDTLTGGTGRDQFVYNGNVFANGTPTLAAQPNINVLNQPDIITDFTIGEDQFTFDGTDLGLSPLVSQRGTASQLVNTGTLANSNVIVLSDSFAAAGAAARAIANNDNIQANEGIFVYFNTTLGLTRVVYSQDLGDGGNISVLANLDNQRGAIGQTNLANFTAAEFALA